jgi:dTDP-4-dehydrorhamnose 3,5-epimerase
MRFSETELQGVWIIDIEPHTDSRGLFARTFCAEEFRARGLPNIFCQASTSWNAVRGTLRGMHYQKAPSQEAKLVRCTRGELYDVVLDLRIESPTFGRSVGFELSEDSRRSIMIPHGCAHGFVTLTDATEVLYMMSEPHAPHLACGVRWNDPHFSISWPLAPVAISERDASYADFVRERGEG